MIKVSIILPIYDNKSINKTFESIINQKITDIEVICILADTTNTTAEKYSQKYDFIKLYEENIKQQSTIRNYGIEIAKGEYVAFIDEDTILVDETSLDKMFLFGYVNDANIVCGNIKTRQDNEKIVRYENKDIQFDYFLTKPRENSIPTLFMRYIYKRSFLIENNIKFRNNISITDPQFLIEVLINVENVYNVNTNYQFVRYNDLELSSYEEKYEFIKISKDCYDMLDDAGFSEMAEKLMDFIMYYIRYKKNSLEMRQVINEVFDDKDHYFKNKTDKLLIELVGQKQLNKYSEIKKQMINETLTSDNFIDYETLREYNTYEEDINEKFNKEDVKKASKLAIKTIKTM